MFDHISSMETQSKRPADAVQLQVVTVTIYSRRRKYNGHVPVLNQWSHFLGQVFHASIQEHLSQLCRSQLLPGHLKTIQMPHVNNCRDVAPLCLSVRPSVLVWVCWLRSVGPVGPGGIYSCYCCLSFLKKAAVPTPPTQLLPNPTIWKT